jgi:hypothetical protein
VPQFAFLVGVTKGFPETVCYMQDAKSAVIKAVTYADGFHPFRYSSYAVLSHGAVS